MVKSYRFIKNTSIYSGKICVPTADGKEVDIQGKVWLEYHPNLSLKWSAICRKKRSVPKIFIPGEELNFEYFQFINGVIYKPSITSRIWSSDEPSKLYGIVNSLTINDQSKSINEIQFELVNFFFSSGEQSENLIKFNIDSFEVLISKLENYKDVIEKLKIEGSFAVTCIGVIKKKDNSNFLYKDASDIMSNMMWALSFANGGFVFSVKLQGYNYNELNWINYRIQRFTSYNNKRDNWCHPSYPGQFYKFMIKFEDFYKISSEVCRKWTWNACIDWYIHALNSDTLESKILHTQAALELFSWTYLIQDAKLISKTKYKKQSFSENLRQLLSLMKIDYLNRVSSFIAEPSRDAVDDFVGLRNDIVHPEKSSLFSHFTDKRKVAADGLRMLELVILAKLGYDGSYLDRRKSPFESTEVPWKTT